VLMKVSMNIVSLFCVVAELYEKTVPIAFCVVRWIIDDDGLMMREQSRKRPLTHLGDIRGHKKFARNGGVTLISDPPNTREQKEMKHGVQ
jgi:hypothetical protein